MTEEEKKVVTGEVEEMPNNYADTLINQDKMLKAMAKKLEESEANNKKLSNYVLNGGDIGQPEVEEKESIEELRHKAFDNPHQTNLEYITNVLKLRERLMEEGQEDPFVASSSQYTPTIVDYADAQGVAQALQEMVDVADGDPNVFLNEYQRRVKDTTTPVNKKR